MAIPTELPGRWYERWHKAFVQHIIVLFIAVILNFFLQTQLGLALRACGDNEDMVRASSIDTDKMKVLGLVIICDYFYDHRNHKIQGTSRTILFIYALVYMIYGGMLIAVASPDIWFAISLIIVGFINIILSIKLFINAFLNKK